MENFPSKDEAEKISFLPADYKVYSFNQIKDSLVKLEKGYYNLEK